jgi:hypothetical protein
MENSIFLRFPLLRQRKIIMFWNNRSLAEAVAFFPFLPSFFGKLDSEHASDVIDCQFPGLVATMSRKRKQNGTNYRGKQRHHHNMLCDK